MRQIKLLYLIIQGFEAAIQIDGKVYDLQTNTIVASEGTGPILFYTRNKSTNSPVLLDASLQDSVRYSKLFVTFRCDLLN